MNAGRSAAGSVLRGLARLLTVLARRMRLARHHPPVLVPKPDWPPLRSMALRALVIHMHSTTPRGIL